MPNMIRNNDGALLRLCKLCQKPFKPRGLLSHESKCKKNFGREADATRRYRLKKLNEMAVKEVIAPQKDSMNCTPGPASFPSPQWDDPGPGDTSFVTTAEENLDHFETERLDELSDGDIKIEYHPNSGKEPEMLHFDEYVAGQTGHHAIPPPTDFKPWIPFQTRMDFELAALALECTMNKGQTDMLIEIVKRAQEGHDQCTLKNFEELQKTWNEASEKSTRFRKEEISVPYRGLTECFDVYYRPLWDWTLELLMDPRIAPNLNWHARRLFRYHKASGTWKRFVNEPWTANRWWEVQDSLPDEGVPLCFIFYADKSKLSSFGTAKGYPVIVRLANLPIGIRNSAGLGGGCVVGWYPIVKEDTERSGKTDFVNFKCIVWHESAMKILDSIILHAQTGYLATCGDGIRRRMFPLILLEVADYEEQCVICLIRGLGGLCPCPRCDISKDELATYTVGNLRTADEAVKILAEADSATTKADKEEIVKALGMRPVFNAFFKLPNSDPYSGVSFDNLHFKFGGLWGAHMFPQLKAHVDNLTDSRIQAANIDERFKKFPHWSGLPHFSEGVWKLSFNDGSKHRAISHIFLFVAHDVLREDNDKAGFQLLKALRAYLNVDMLSELHHQTNETISSGRAAVREMFGSIKKYISLNTDLEKNWNFIKFHYHMHLFDDIENKGSLKGMSTMPNEKLHGPIRKIYLNRTNFKDVGDQITRIEHQSVVAGLIQGQIDALDEHLLPKDADEPDDVESSIKNAHFCLGSKQRVVSFRDLEQTHNRFSRFRLSLSDFISQLLPASNIPLPGNRYFKFSVDDKITPYQYLKVQYESLDTWQVESNHLRCSPSFNGSPRYDFILFDSISGPIFAQLWYLFACIVDDHTYPIAFVQSYKPVSHSRRTRSDKTLGLLRLRKEPKMEFISLRSIIRGAIAVPLDVSANEVFVWDVIDGDMYLRVLRDFPGYNAV
ncbi:hypothetical protein EV361DRAFT_879617 [Lentinula raphanica]|nr:hypothetical protein EV361DRAFT_879617 [Lentinula raphanica]